MNLNIKKSITMKIFIITMVLFITFMSLTFIFQSLFFEKFYINKKKRTLNNSVASFINDYHKANDIQSILSLMKEFEINTSSKIVILDSNGQLEFITKSGFGKEDNDKLRAINGIIFQMVQNNVIDSIINNNKMITYVSDGKDSDVRGIICAAPDNKKNEIIFALTSLQPINEAGTVFKELFLYFYIGAIFVILLLSYLFSNMITKPLKEINRAALDMANLDFSKKSSIKSEDEIGSLSDSLNILSTNLNNSLTSLKNANTKLEEDIEKQKKSEKMRKEFVASVSHELKTPVSLIEGYAEGIKDGIFEEDEQNTYVDIIIDEAKKMGNLITDMLDVSQMESGTFNLIKENFYIDELCNEVIKKYSSMMEEKKLIPNISIEENVLVNGDRRRIEQVISNFITNSIRYTNDEKYISIKLKKEDNKVRFEIENSCEKISEEELKKIWDIFYKVDKSGNKKLGGTGIGLAIVKNIIQLHGGECSANSTGKGICFFFTIHL